MRRRGITAALLATWVLVAPPARAATWRWTGLDPTSSAWSRPQNWDLLTAPANDGTATLVFPDISASARHDPTADVPWDVATLEISGDDPYVLSGAQLSLRGPIVAAVPFGIQSRVANPVVLVSDSRWSNDNSGSLLVTGSVNLGSRQLTLSPMQGDVRLIGDVSGTGRLVKDHGGVVHLGGHNTYSGGTTLQFGLLVADAPQAIPPGPVTLQNGLLDLGTTGSVLGPGAVAADGLVLGGVISGAVSVTGFPIRIAALGDWLVYDPTDGMSETLMSGTLDLDTPDGTRVIRVGDSFTTTEEVTVLAAIVNPGSVPGGAPAIRKLGPGNIQLGGINTFARALQIEEGIVVVFRPEAFGAGGPANPTIVLGGSLDLVPGCVVPNETLHLNGSGAGGAGALYLRSSWGEWGGPVLLDADASIGVYTPVGFETPNPGLTVSGIVSGPGALTKVGEGLLRLTAANIYQGATIVQGGVLAADNTSGHAVPGALTVAGGGTLAGDGSVGGPVLVQSGGIVAPAGAGAATASLAAQAVTFSPGATLRLPLTGNGSNARLDVASAAQLAGGLALTLVPPYTPAAGHAFTLINYQSHSGQFTSLSLPALNGGLTWALDDQADRLIARVVSTTGVGDAPVTRTWLAIPSPNPFATRTRIRVELAQAAHARLEIVDIGGRLVAAPLDADHGPGAFDVEWAGTTTLGTTARSGLYFARLSVDGRPVAPVRRIVLAR